MKKLVLTALTLVILLPAITSAQSRVREKDLKGEWFLVIDIDEEEIERDIEDSDTILGEIIAESIADFVFDVADEIEVVFIFKDNHRLRMEIEVFGEREIEYGHWYINQDGELIIDDDDDDREDDVWLMVGDKLMGFEKGRNGRLEEKNLILVKRKS